MFVRRHTAVLVLLVSHFYQFASSEGYETFTPCIHSSPTDCLSGERCMLLAPFYSDRGVCVNERGSACGTPEECPLLGCTLAVNSCGGCKGPLSCPGISEVSSLSSAFFCVKANEEDPAGICSECYNDAHCDVSPDRYCHIVGSLGPDDKLIGECRLKLPAGRQCDKDTACTSGTCQDDTCQ